MTERLPLVSVVIDNYNYGRFLAQCIQSVLDQDYPSGMVETLVIDDGSEDDSREVAARFKGKITLIEKPNAGQASAFNAGIAAATGDLVMFLDADDYWDRRKIKTAARGFSDPRVGIVQNLLTEVDARGTTLKIPAYEWPPRYSIKDYLAGGAVLSASSGLAMRRSLLMDVGPIPLDISYAMCTELYLLVHGLFDADAINIPIVLGFHRLHGQNSWGGSFASPQKLRIGLKMQQIFNRYLEAKIRARGLEFSPFYLFIRDIDAGRQEILLAMHEGHRRQAFDHWRQLWKKYGATRLGFFRCATLMLALVSVDLYLRFYEFYNANPWPSRLRRWLLPER